MAATAGDDTTISMQRDEHRATKPEETGDFMPCRSPLGRELGHSSVTMVFKHHGHFLEVAQYRRKENEIRL
jgi:hypothetical protein